MLLNIDVEGLQSKKKSLEEELSQVTQLLNLVEKFKVTQKSEPTLKSWPPAEEEPQPKTNGKRRIFHQGHRREVILALHTGAASEHEIAQALGWEIKHLRRVLGTMIPHKLCFLNEHGKLQLSTEGRKQAEWFLRNTGYTKYLPKLVK